LNLELIKTTDFRCFESLQFEPETGFNLIFGANACGKTSILEAIAYLGRGRSFRGAGSKELIRHGRGKFVLFGRATERQRRITLGVSNGKTGIEIHVNGARQRGAASLATAFTLQIVEPEVHKLVAGGPEERRRYLDWIAFHVEPGYLEKWRRFRRALRQRNAALRSGSNGKTIRSWNQEYLLSAAPLHASRVAAVELVRNVLKATGEQLLGAEVGVSYQQGWRQELSLEEALEGALLRDREQGLTHTGPHRGELVLRIEERLAKRLVSRGQQKLLACALVLGSVKAAQQRLGQALVLLLDDPAAELDEDSLRRLMSCVSGLGCQVIATALTADGGLFQPSAALFHVEQGAITRTA